MKKKHNLRKAARILVEHVLNKDPLSANEIFKRLILEAEKNREAEAEEEAFDDFDFDFEPDDAEGDVEDTDAEGGEDEGGEEGFDDFEFDEEGEEGAGDVPDIESMDNAESDELADDVVEINCQINAKVISNLFDKIAEIKSALEGLNLDENSREYLKYDVTIQYYSDKLQDLQGKTNPGIDQTKVEEGLTKITTALEQLEGEIGGGSMETELTDIESPEEVAAENDLADTEGSEEPEETEDVEEGEEEDIEVSEGEPENEEGDSFEELKEEPEAGEEK